MTLSFKPCPFCGQTPTVEPWHGGGPEKVMVACPGLHPDDEIKSCEVSPCVTGETPKEAADHWNGRSGGSAEWPIELTPTLSEILGSICYEFIQLAQLYREAGVEIPTKAEAEQAYFIHRYLTHWFAAGDDWGERMGDEISSKVEIVKAKRAQAEAAA